MEIFETVLVLLLGATILSALARRMGIPYPTLLALGGACVAFLPHGPRLDMAPELILALLVAPVLVDAAHDTSLRDLRKSWVPILSLVLGAVAITTAAVAIVARWLLPDMPWAAAIALGALLAPPDAVAAIAVLSELNPPFRIRTVLEGESLLNDASALLIYKLAIAALLAGSFSMPSVVPSFVTVVIGSALLGWLAVWPVAWINRRVRDAPSSVIFQFVNTFGLWLLADHLGLSGVVTMVVFAITMAQRFSYNMPARLRIPSYAIWETSTTILNVLAFTLIGLQLRPIVGSLTAETGERYVMDGVLILLCVIVVRIAWVFAHHYCVVLKDRLLLASNGSPEPSETPTTRGALLVGWSGMRGMVTLAAAMALPINFPYRDFIQLAAFIVVVGTLVLQGCTLRPLMHLLRLPADYTLQQEVQQARDAAMRAGLAAVAAEPDAAAGKVRREFEMVLSRLQASDDPRMSAENRLRRKAIVAARQAIVRLRSIGTIGDSAFQLIESELDRREIILPEE